MKKSLFLFTALLLLTTTAFGQKRHKKKKAKENESSIYVSGLLNIDTEEFIVEQQFYLRTFTVSMSTDSAEINYTIPRNISNFGFTLQKIDPNKTYQEISLTRLTFSREDYLNTTTRTDVNGTRIGIEVAGGLTNSIWDIQTRYEFGKNILDDKIINFGIGIASEPSFLYSNIDFKLSGHFPLKTIRTRLHLTAVPVVSFNITENFALGIKVIPNIFNIEWNWSRSENPSLTERQRVTSDFNTTFFNNNIATNIIARFRIQSGEGKKKGKSK